LNEKPPLSPWGDGPKIVKQRGVTARDRMAGYAVAAFLMIGALATQSFYIVNPTELAFTRTFGRVDQAADSPVTPGVHFKIPFATVVDRMQISVDTVALPEDLRVLSHDGQVIQLGVSLTRRIPPEAVYNLLYNTGGVGNVDIDRNIFAIVADRTLTIFGREDVLNIASERERIIGLMKTSIASEIHRLFGVDLIDLQITGFRFSPEYERAVNENSLAKTNAFRAEQILKQKEVEARQQVAEATGRADSAIQTARGESESTLLKAQAEGKATEIQASADAAAIKLRVDAAGGIDAYSKVMAADTMKRWNGQTPQTVFGGTGLPAPLFQVH
jgi:regulator of protease activity HflC (stomatin/prohibitin superfamily)